jgi:predicted dehydrogenase
MSRRIKVGVFGAGDWGPNLIRHFRLLPGCHLKMMCDDNAACLNNLRALYSDVAAEESFDHMLNGVGLDAVAVTTRVKFHFPMARAALLAGKHVLIEKPMAASVAECEELIEIARRNGLVLMVGQTALYSPAVSKIKEIIDRGDLGQIRHICARHLDPGLGQKDCNVAWDQAPHDISIILHLLQQHAESVNCSGSSHINPQIEDVTSTLLNFGKDCSAIIHNSWLEPRPVRELTIVGSRQMLLYDDLAPLEKVRIFDTRVERPPNAEALTEFKYTYHYGGVSSPYLKQDEPVKTECLHFLECIEQSKNPLTCGAHGLEVVKILEASSASLKLGGAMVSLMPSESAPLATAHVCKRRPRANTASKLEELVLPQLISNRAHQATVAVESAALPCQ